MKFWHAAAASLALGFAGPAIAQSPNMGWYIGGSFGQSQFQDACEGISGPGISCDEKDSAWKIFGGYQLNRNFAIELGYTNLGETSASEAGVSVAAEASAFELVGIGFLPLADRFSAYGKVGLYRAESEGRLIIPGLGSGSIDESNTDLTYGFGLKFDISRNLALRGEWQRYSEVGGGDLGGEADIDVLSVGLMYRF